MKPIMISLKFLLKSEFKNVSINAIVCNMFWPSKAAQEVAFCVCVYVEFNVPSSDNGGGS